jgi:CubicO group peptidase (beta-lactamase class C family)
MKSLCKFLIILCLLRVEGNAVYAQQNDDYSAKIDSLMLTTSPRIFNGVVLITQNGTTKYAKAHGYSNFETKTPISLKDNFRIQSNSKQITAVLILQEVEKGKIDLHSPIRKYLPDLKQAWTDTVTVHHLLNMSSGVMGVDTTLRFKPGTNFYYSNPGYGLLGRILEKVTGETLINKANKLFRKLGMKNSYCYEIGKANPGLINGYSVSDTAITVLDFKSLNMTQEAWKDFIPTGGMISTAKDLNIWDGKLHKGKILKAASYQAMITSDIKDNMEVFSSETASYGYGVDVNEKKPIRYIGHAGRGIGFVSLKFYVPEKDLDVIIWENLYNPNAKIIYHFEKVIREIVLNSVLVR